MDQDLERLRTIFEADISRFERAMNTYANRTEAAARRAEKSFGDANKKISASTDRMARDVRRAVAGIAIAVGGRELTQYADQWVDLNNKVKAAGEVSGIQGRAMLQLAEDAKQARSQIEPYVDLYSRILRSAKGITESEADIARVTQLTARAFAAGGAGASEQAAGVLQLGQALGSGFLQGDELRSLRENAPLVAKAIADAMGVSIGKLKELGAEGKLTSDIVFNALLQAEDQINAAFGVTLPRASSAAILAFDELALRIGKYLEETGSVRAGSEAIAGAINFVADNLEAFANAVVVSASFLGGVFAGQALLAVVTGFAKVTKGATGAAAALAIFNKAAGVFGGPLPLLIGAIAGAFVLLAQNGTRLTRAMEDVEAATAGANKALAATEKYVDKDLLTQLGDSAEGAAPKVSLLGGKLREVADALRDATIQQFLQELLDLQTQISNANEAITEAQAAREKERRRSVSNAGLGTQVRAASGQDVGDIDAPDFDQAVSEAKAALFNLQKRQNQIGISVFGEGRGKEFTDALLSGDIGAASELLRKRLDQLTGAASDGGGAPPTTDDSAIKAAQQVLDQLAKAYRDTFETESDALARIRDERLDAIDLVAKSEADREARRREAIHLYANAMEQLAIQEAKADQEQLERDREAERQREERIAGEKSYLAEVIDSRDRMFGRVQQIAQREYELRQAEIKREITDNALQKEALLALEEEYGEQRRLVREELLKIGDPQSGLDSEIARLEEAERAKLKVLEDGYAAKIILEEEYQAEKRQLEASTDAAIEEARRASASAQLSAYEGLFANVGELFKQLGGEQSKAARVALAISRAFAIADSTIKIAQATSQVLADPTQVTLPQKIAAAAVIAAQGASIIAAIAGGGKGFAQGGYVSGPGGPRTDSIPARLSNGEFVVNAEATRANRQLLEAINAGRSIPMAMAAPVLRAPDIRVINNAPGVIPRAQRSASGEIEVIIDAIAQDIARGGGRVGMALEGRYGVNPAWGS